MRMTNVDQGVATCLLVDEAGSIRLEYHATRNLITMRQAMSPRSRWPETNHSDELELQEEVRRTSAAKRARRKASKKAAKKRSLRIKRMVAA